jgi:hypothetical protein
MTHQEITNDQATLLAAFVAAIRDDWDTPGLMKAFETARLRVGVTPADLAVAAIHASANPKNRTPAVIPLDGDHWREHNRPLDTPTPAGKCEVCHGYHNRLPCPGPVRIGDHRSGITGVRAAYTEVREQLCAHGVLLTDCKRHEEAV